MSTLTARAASRHLQAYMVQRGVDAGDYGSSAGTRLVRLLGDQAWQELYGTSTVGREERSEADRELGQFLAQILSTRGPDTHGYLNPAVAYGRQQLVAGSHACGCRVVRTQLRPRWFSEGERCLYICERCGIIAHTHGGAALPASCALAEQRIIVPLPDHYQDGWFVGCVQPIGGHRENATAVARFARGPEGHLSFELPGDGSPGLRRVGVALVSDGDYTILQMPFVRPWKE
jgi:hypothetical protein